MNYITTQLKDSLSSGLVIEVVTLSTLLLNVVSFLVSHVILLLYNRTPLNWINWNGEPSSYVENLDNWVFL
jgi:hypothetical protein